MENAKIAEALKICARKSPCPKKCPLFGVEATGEECARQLMETAADVITALQAENQRLREIEKSYDKLCDEKAKSDTSTIRTIMTDNQEIDQLTAELSDLRGKIERGELVELPCKPGDYVWVSKKCFEKSDRWSVYWERKPYVRCAVVGFKWTKGGLSISLHPLTERTMNTRTHKFFRLSSIGRTVFITEESARARLEGDPHV